eukprot:Em0007g1162a
MMPQTDFEHSGDCDVSDELVNDLEGPDVDCDVIAHGSGTRVSSHATTDVESDEDSEDDSDVGIDESYISSDVGRDESYISSDVGRDVGRDVDSAMQEDDVRVICDEVTDAQDLRAPTMQECVPEAVFSAAASSTDCSPCIVNSTKQHLDMRIEKNWNTLHNHVSNPSIPGIITDISDGARAKYLASNVGLNKLATSFKNECFKSDTGRYMARTSQAQNGNDTSTCS